MMDLQKAESTSEVVKQDVVKSNGDIANEDTEEMGLLVYSDSEDEIALKEDRESDQLIGIKESCKKSGNDTISSPGRKHTNDSNKDLNEMDTDDISEDSFIITNTKNGTEIKDSTSKTKPVEITSESDIFSDALTEQENTEEIIPPVIVNNVSLLDEILSSDDENDTMEAIPASANLLEDILSSDEDAITNTLNDTVKSKNEKVKEEKSIGNGFKDNAETKQSSGDESIQNEIHEKVETVSEGKCHVDNASNENGNESITKTCETIAVNKADPPTDTIKEVPKVNVGIEITENALLLDDDELDENKLPSDADEANESILEDNLLLSDDDFPETPSDMEEKQPKTDSVKPSTETESLMENDENETSEQCKEKEPKSENKETEIELKSLIQSPAEESTKAAASTEMLLDAKESSEVATTIDSLVDDIHSEELKSASDLEPTAGTSGILVDNIPSKKQKSTTNLEKTATNGSETETEHIKEISKEPAAEQQTSQAEVDTEGEEELLDDEGLSSSSMGKQEEDSLLAEITQNICGDKDMDSDNNLLEVMADSPRCSTDEENNEDGDEQDGDEQVGDEMDEDEIAAAAEEDARDVDEDQEQSGDCDEYTETNLQIDETVLECNDEDLSQESSSESVLALESKDSGESVTEENEEDNRNIEEPEITLEDSELQVTSDDKELNEANLIEGNIEEPEMLIEDSELQETGNDEDEEYDEASLLEESIQQPVDSNLEQPAIDDEPTDSSTSQEIAIDAEPADSSTAQETAIGEEPADSSTLQETAIDEEPADSSTLEETAIDDEPADSSTLGETAIDEEPADSSTLQKTAIDEEPADSSTLEDTAIDEEPADSSTLQETAIEEEPADSSTSQEVTINKEPADSTSQETAIVDSVKLTDPDDSVTVSTEKVTSDAQLPNLALLDESLKQKAVDKDNSDEPPAKRHCSNSIATETSVIENEDSADMNVSSEIEPAVIIDLDDSNQTESVSIKRTMASPIQSGSEAVKRIKLNSNTETTTTAGTSKIQKTPTVEKELESAKKLNTTEDPKKKQQKLLLDPRPKAISKSSIPLQFCRKFKKSIEKMTRSDMEEMILQKVVEAIFFKSDYAEMRSKVETQENVILTYRTKLSELSKQFRDLEMVHNRVIKDLEVRNNNIVTPVKITRAVGLQVSLTRKDPIVPPAQPAATVTSAQRPVAGPSTSQPQAQAQAPVQQHNLVRKMIKGYQLPPPGPYQNTHPQVLPSNANASAPPPINPQLQQIMLLKNQQQQLKQQQQQQAKSLQNSQLKQQLNAPPKPAQMQHKVMMVRKSLTPVTTSPGNPLHKMIKVTPQQSGITRLPPVIVKKVTGVPPKNISSPSTSAAASGYQSPTTGPQQKQHPSVPQGTIDLTEEDDPKRTSIIQNGTNPPALVAIPQKAGKYSYVSVQQKSPGGQSQQSIQFPQGTRLQMQKGSNQFVQIAPKQNASPVVPQQLIAQAQRKNAVHAPNPRRHPAPLPFPNNQVSNSYWKRIPPRPIIRINNIDSGIVISWTMDDMSEDHADISSYQIYAYQETSALPSTETWRHVGDVKSMTLPMAVTLTQFQEGQRYHFAVRALDEHSRCGVFSIPRTWA